MITNDCETCRGQLVPGILSHNLTEQPYREWETVERCDTCERFGSDEVARDVYEVIRWGRTVIDSWPDVGDVGGAINALDVSLADLLADESAVA